MTTVFQKYLGNTTWKQENGRKKNMAFLYSFQFHYLLQVSYKFFSNRSWLIWKINFGNDDQGTPNTIFF
jgi:hypothetical protein